MKFLFYFILGIICALASIFAGVSGLLLVEGSPWPAAIEFAGLLGGLFYCLMKAVGCIIDEEEKYFASLSPEGQKKYLLDRARAWEADKHAAETYISPFGGMG